MLYQIAILAAMMGQVTQAPPATQPAAETMPMVTTFDGIDKLTGAPVDIEATDDGKLIIYGDPNDIKILTDIARALDTQPGIEPDFRIFKLDHAQAAELAPKIEKFWNEVTKPVKGKPQPEDRITIIPDPRSNKLMVAATDFNMMKISDIILQLDQPTLDPVKLYVPVQLKHIRVTEAEKILTEMLENLEKRRGTKQKLFDIKADLRTNSLLISAPEKDLEQIRHIIEIIDVETKVESWSVVKMAIFPLQKAVAADLVKTLQEMLQTGDQEVEKAMKEQIRRLQILLKKPGQEAQEVLADLDLDKPIKIFADSSANAAIVATAESNLKPIGELIKLLDTVPVAEGMIVNIFPLKYADAESLEKMLEGMFKEGKELVKIPGRESEIDDRVPPDLTGKALVHNISISADVRTNMLVVAGQPDQMLLVQKTIEAMDIPDPENRFQPRMIYLEKADVRRAAEIAEKIAEMRQESAKKISPLAEERERILVIPDVRTNSMIVIANDANYEELVDLANKLDKMKEVPYGDARIIILKNLVASELVDKIDKLWERRAQIRKEEELPEDTPVIVADTRSNALVIASNPEDFEAIKKLVADLEVLELSPMADIRLLKLEHNDAAKVADTVEQLFEERIKISQVKGEEDRPSEKVAVIADPLTNTLLIASTKPKYEEIVRLIEELDVPLPVEGLIRVFPIVHADVTNTAKLLQDMFKEGLYRGGGAGEKELPESLTKVTIVSDLRSSSIIVSASPENFSIVELLLKQIDREDTPMFKAEAQFFPLKHADVVKVADTLEKLFEGMQKTLKDEKELIEVTLVPDMGSNILIVSGTRLAMKRVEELLPKLDQPSMLPTSIMEVYVLEKASASQLEPIMTKLFEERSPSDLKDKQTPIIILPDDGSNSLVVTASQQDHITVKELLEKLDRESTIADQVALIALKEAKAEQLAETLEDLIKKQQEGNKDRQGGFAITPDERTNALVVWAPPDMLDNIRTIVTQLDSSKTAVEMAMKVFKLYNAKAEDLSELLEEFFDAAGAGDDKEARQLIIDFAPVDPSLVEKGLKPLIYQDITFKPDKNTNSLLVMAPKDHIDMMEMLVTMLDSVEPLTATVKVFTLRNSDATEMKDLLDELFQTEEKGTDEDRRKIVIGGEGAAAAAGVEGAAGLELAFSVDERTNSLIAAGSEVYLKTVEELVVKLDMQEIEQRIVQVVHLQHTKAEDVADRLSQYFEEESGAIEEAAEGEATARQLERHVTIIDGGEVSNTLLVSYSPRMESQVVDMINELDQMRPSVMIQVLMAEVTLEDRFEMGMEFAVQDLLFSEKAVLGQNGLIQGDGFDFVLGSDVGAAGGTGLGGFTFTVSGEDFNFLLRALQTEGRLEVLSRPSIMVQDNEEANITVGEMVPVVKDVTISGAGQVTPSVSYEEVGIILDVTPIISPDGYVQLEIAPEISAIGTSSIPIATGVNLPTFTERSAETIVTVKDGETIIIGGLITSKENTNENKVPVVGDIPLLGNLFRSNVRSTTKTELLIILTPHVIRDVESARTVSVEMRDQTG
ncbi:MAG: secretin N-terminal domain-containing protein, partial [Planctomycetota bacterium]